MVWYGAGIRKLGDGDGVATYSGGETEIKVFIIILLCFRRSRGPSFTRISFFLF